MTNFSTLFYLVDDTDSTSDESEYQLLINDNFDHDFMNTYFKSLVFDPGDELVKKIMRKAAVV